MCVCAHRLLADGAALVAHASRHLQAREHAAWCGGCTDGTVLTVTLATVGHETSVVVPALDGTCAHSHATTLTSTRGMAPCSGTAGLGAAAACLAV